MKNLQKKALKVLGISFEGLSREQLLLGFRRGVTQQHRIVEMVFFACLLPVLGLLVFPSNPTGLGSGFPWVVAGPLLFAARYGSGWGVSCGFLSGLFFVYPFSAYAGLAPQHVSLAIGTFIMSLIVGDAATSWRKRSQKAEAENQYLRHRLKEFSTDYHVLKVSHGLLEEYMAGQRLSLREALQQLKPVLSSSTKGIQAGNELMAVFSQFCSIQVAGLYTMSDGKMVDKTPVATHGDMFELPVFDPLLRVAIRTQEVASIKLESLAEKHHESSLLAVVPLVDTAGHMHGLLAIKDMHFMAFQQQNLRLLALLGYYVGDQLTRSRGAALSRSEWFLAELDTVLRFSHSHSTESALLCLKFAQSEDSNRISEFVSTAIRSLDASWLIVSDDNTPVVSLLLPLMSEPQSHAFLQRLNEAVEKEFDVVLDDVIEGSRMHQINDMDSRVSCLSLLTELTGSAAMGVALRGNELDQGHSGVA